MRRSWLYGVGHSTSRLSWPEAQQQRREVGQVRGSEPRSPSSNDDEGVLRDHARPPRWQRRHVSGAITVKDPVLTPVTPLDDVDLLATLWMERVRDSDWSCHLGCATCS